MKTMLLTLTLLLSTTTLTTAQSLNEFQWKSRLIVLFTPEPTDPVFEEQVRLLQSEHDRFEERNVVFIFVTPEGRYENTGLFLNESFSRQYYDKFNPQQYEFTLVLVDYDGNEKYRAKNRLTPPSILLEQIDREAVGQRKLLEGRGNKSMRNDRKTTSKPASTRRDF